MAASTKQAILPTGGAYTYKTVLHQLPLGDGDKKAAQISCLEFWEGNLYVGTSAGELLHFVSLPPENPSEEATFILASRLEPTPSNALSSALTGIQRILIVPRSRKACILSNNVLTFHSLPELSPAAGNKKVSGCQWIGGLDLDLAQQDAGLEEDIVLIGLGRMIRMLRIGEEVNGISKIQFPGCLEAVRRSRFACAADSHQYALLDLDNQQKIPLFPISSIDETPAATQIETLASPSEGHVRSTSASTLNTISSPQAHQRQQSLGDRLIAQLQQAQKRPQNRDKVAEEVTDPGSESRSPATETTPEFDISQKTSPKPPLEQDKPLPEPPTETAVAEATKKSTELLKPFILSPTEEEFLLTTGTSPSEAGVGMFVNLEGDVVRGTLEFSKYPASIAIDDQSSNGSTGADGARKAREGFVIAAISRLQDEVVETGLEVQRWDKLGAEKSWISLGNWPFETQDGESSSKGAVGVVSAFTTQTVGMQEISQRLRSSRLQLRAVLGDDSSTTPSPNTSSEDAQFWSRIDRGSSRIMCWSGSSIYLVLKNPLLVQLEDTLTEIMARPEFQQDQLLQLVGRIQNMEVSSEADFLSLAYVRQKVSLFAFEDLITNRMNINPQISEKLFTESDLDPRVVISMVPLFRSDVDEGPSGIRLSQGLVTVIEERLLGLSISLDPDEVLSRPDDYDVLGLIKRYLLAWRKKKGYASITDEAHVFRSVDAALLHLILQQDAQSGQFPGSVTTLKLELYALVGQGVSCSERAIHLLEQYQRLYALSRLYGNRREPAKVLQTWRRIMEGEGDASGEFANPDGEMRRYLGLLKDQSLIEEYGAYLARRNPSFGVQVFTDETSKVKMAPEKVVKLLESEAPDAVKVYLEHLVFGKKNFQYANDLISYYLNSVLSVLGNQQDESGRTMLEETYQTYRALAAPKPTYRQFIAENGPPNLQWWNDRLRLLELLGGTFGANFHYDVAGVQAWIREYSQWLVPESIILEGRQGNHTTALKLLTHGLGDYHTAVNYCMLGGASIFHPAMAAAAGVQVPDREEQRALFSTVFHEFLRLEDEGQRQEQVGILLGRFEGWFVLEEVLPNIPETWPLEVIEGFLVGAIRRVVQDKAESMIVKALSGAANTIVTNEFAEKCQSGGPIVITEEEQAT